MGTGGDEAARGLAQEIVGVVRVTAFGTSIVAPAGSVISVLIVMMSYAGFASPLVVLISFAGSMCCAVSFADSASSASFLLPGNDIAHDNTSQACGPGHFSLVE